MAEIAKSSGTQARSSATNDVLEGATFRDIESGHRLYGEIDGVEVANVTPGSRASRLGLRTGDVILSANRRPVRDLEEFERVMSQVEGTIALHVQRGSSRIFLVIR